MSEFDEFNESQGGYVPPDPADLPAAEDLTIGNGYDTDDTTHAGADALDGANTGQIGAEDVADTVDATTPDELVGRMFITVDPEVLDYVKAFLHAHVAPLADIPPSDEPGPLVPDTRIQQTRQPTGRNGQPCRLAPMRLIPSTRKPHQIPDGH